MVTKNRQSHKQVEAGLDFTGKCLDGIDLSERTILRTTFESASMRRSRLNGAEFRECSFAGANLDHAQLHRTVFENCDFSGASLTNANVQEATFRSTTVLRYGAAEKMLRPARNSFDGAVFDGSSFRRARLVAARLHNVTAKDVDFSDCDLRNSSFDGTTLKDVNFFGARLLDANFAQCPDAHAALPEYAKLMVKLVQPISTGRLEEVLDAHLRWLASDGKEGDRLSMKGMDLAGRNLDGYDFSGTDFRGARLDRASMRHVKLVAADLRMASMISTNFSSSDLRGALVSPGALRRAILVETSYDPEALSLPVVPETTPNPPVP